MYKSPDYELIELDNGEYLLLNLVNGCADILNSVTAKIFEKNQIYELELDIINQLIEREYIFKSKKEYLNFIYDRNTKLLELSKNEAPNFIYIPTYKCNLNCYYCFEKGYENTSKLNESVVYSSEIFEEFCTNMIAKLEKNNKLSYKKEDILITITGGEPLLLSNYVQIEKILKWTDDRGFKVSIVTNGTTLNYYEDLLKRYRINQLQITLDGSKEVHDKVRIGHKGEPTFDLIINNIDSIQNIVDDIVVRINITEKNIDSIKNLEPLFRRFPKITFYTYLMQQEGCSDENNIICEVDGLKQLFNLKNSDDSFTNLSIEYHGRTFIESVLGLREFNPVIKTCSAMQNQYILDFSGKVYKCWWGMGNLNYSVGSFENGVINMDYSHHNLYINRNIVNIPICIKCKYRYICGGGCSGKLNNTELANKNVICPDFKKIFEFVFPKVI